MSTMYDTLLKLPLFQGLSQEDFTAILSKVKLNFIRYKAGDVILKSGTSCRELVFLLKGEAEAATTSPSKLFTYAETIKTPYLIEPEALFGMTPQFKSTYTAKTEVSVMTVDKTLVLNSLLKYNVFRLNYVNSVSNRAQSIYSRLWQTSEGGTKQKVIHFILTHAEKLEGEKTIFIKMENLAKIIDDTRLNVSRVLNELQSKGLLELRRKVIYIPEIKSFIQEECNA